MIPKDVTISAIITNWSAPALERSKHKHKIDKNFLGKVESELYENLNASKIARPQAHSDSSNSSEGGMAKMRVENMDKKLADFRMSYMRKRALEENE